jgi:hypothetical protein
MLVVVLVVPERFVCCGRTVPGRGREHFHEDFFPDERNSRYTHEKSS